MTRCGFVAVFGAPNAGKSTLVNRLVGAKVSIVTHKVQTTRAIVRGIAIHNNAQIVFVDTPGIFRPRRRLDRAMVTTAWGGARDADVVLVLLDAERGLTGDAEAMLDAFAALSEATAGAVNPLIGDALALVDEHDINQGLRFNGRVVEETGPRACSSSIPAVVTPSSRAPTEAPPGNRRLRDNAADVLPPARRDPPQASHPVPQARRRPVREDVRRQGLGDVALGRQLRHARVVGLADVEERLGQPARACEAGGRQRTTTRCFSSASHSAD